MTGNAAGTPGYRLNSSVVLRDLHRLLSTFLALGPVRQLAAEADPLLELHELCAEDDIVHLLVSTAVSNRLHLEHMQELRDSPQELAFEPLSGTCGELWTEEKNEASEPLQFREACNKILHAKSIEIFDTKKPVLRLFGTLGRREWMALVEVLDYVRISVRNFEDALN